MESVPIILVLVIVLLGAVALMSAATFEKDRRRIQHYLCERGATDVVVSKAWLTGQRNVSTYDVTYTDKQGAPRHTRCMVPYGWFGDSEIYWKDPV